jgi:hypothetical protein
MEMNLPLSLPRITEQKSFTSLGKELVSSVKLLYC